jgi:hypothetical protein
MITFTSQAINIPVRGKGGMIINGNGLTICPESAWRVCYTLSISLEDLQNWLFGDGTAVNAQIEYYDEETGETIILNKTIVSISSEFITVDQEIDIPSIVDDGNAFVFE